jgi:hypothetical protein
VFKKLMAEMRRGAMKLSFYQEKKRALSYRPTITHYLRIPGSSAACHPLTLLAIARKITSCIFIARSTAAFE